MSISVVIPTYNRPAEVERLCAEIASQLVSDDELIVLDDGPASPPAMGVLTDPRVRVIRNETNLGMVRNWNRVFTVATQEWVCTVHDDDRFAPDGMATLRRAIACFGGAPGVVVGGTLPVPESAGREWRYRYAEPGRWAVLNATTIPSGAAVHRRVFETLGTFDERFRFSADLELFPRYATQFPTVTVDSPPVVEYQVHDANYQFKTWRDPAFLDELSQIVRRVGEHAGMAGPSLDRYVHASMSAHMAYIMRRARANGDRAIYGRMSRRLARRPGIDLRTRARALIGSALGW